MTLQELLYQMLSELNDICEDHEIPYLLTGWSALSAYGYGHFKPNVKVGQIMIRVEDAYRFIEAVNHSIQNGTLHSRSIDYLGTNDRFPGFFIKYYAEDTTAFEIFHEKGYSHHGVSVDVLLAKHQPSSFIMRKKLNIYETGLLTRNCVQPDMSSSEILAGKRFKRFFKKKFSENGEELFRWLVEKYSNQNRAIVCRAYHKPRFRYFGDAGIFDSYSFFHLGEKQFKMPRDAASYIDGLYERYYTVVLKDGIKYPRMFISLDLPYRCLFESMGVDARDYIKKMEGIQNDYLNVYEKHREDSSYFNTTWVALKLFNQALFLRKQYVDSYIDIIEEVLIHGDYIEAFSMLEDYIKYLGKKERNQLDGPDFIINSRLDELIYKYDLRDKGLMVEIDESK